MDICYEMIAETDAHYVKDLCNELMTYQKSKATIHPERFDNMSFETRMIPSLEKAKANFIIVAKDGDEIVGYAYSNISPKTVYSSNL